MSVHPNLEPIEGAVGWCVLVAGAATTIGSLLRSPGDRRAPARKLAAIVLGSGLLLLGVELTVPDLPDPVRLPLVVGALACLCTSLVVRRSLRRHRA